MHERRAAYLERLRCRFVGWDPVRLDDAADLLEELGELLATEPPDPPTTHPTNATHDPHDSKDDA
jgi:hypothetical protein